MLSFSGIKCPNTSNFDLNYILWQNVVTLSSFICSFPKCDMHWLFEKFCASYFGGQERLKGCVEMKTLQTCETLRLEQG